MSKDFDYNEFEKYVKNFEKVNTELKDWLNKFLLKEAQRFISVAKPLTPVDTGFLRNSWYIGNIFLNGENLEVEVGNTAEYASYVEYGHSTVNGSWVNGKFMMTVALDKVQSALPQHFESAFRQFLTERGVN